MGVLSLDHALTVEVEVPVQGVGQREVLFGVGGDGAGNIQPIALRPEGCHLSWVSLCWAFSLEYAGSVDGHDPAIGADAAVTASIGGHLYMFVLFK